MPSKTIQELQKKIEFYKRVLDNVRNIALMILTVGLSSSVIVYLTARSAAPNPLGYNPPETKKYLRESEPRGF